MGNATKSTKKGREQYLTGLETGGDFCDDWGTVHEPVFSQLHHPFVIRPKKQDYKILLCNDP